VLIQMYLMMLVRERVAASEITYLPTIVGEKQYVTKELLIKE